MIKYFCDICGQEIKDDEKSQQLIIDEDKWAFDLQTKHNYAMCNDCKESIFNYIKTLRGK